MTRRNFVRCSSVSAGAVLLAPMGVGTGDGDPLPPASRPVMPEGTTLESTVVRPDADGYRRLAVGPPRRAVLRTDLAERRAVPGAEQVALATLVQVTDLHVTDVQHPLRFEYVDDRCRTAYRPQDLLGTQGAAAMVRRINALRGGPFTGRPVDVVVSTGDNTDNQCGLELDWVLTVLAGGMVWPSSGDPSRFEGTATSGLPAYWHPDGGGSDRYRELGFPEVPDLTRAATTAFRSPGLDVPWLLTMGNHDSCALGTLSCDEQLVGWSTGERKVFAAGGRAAKTLGARLAASSLDEAPDLGDGGAAGLLARISRDGDTRLVAPDPRRAPFTAEGYLAALRDPRHTGAGPHGHGYGPDADPSRLYFTHRIAERVVVASLDTTNPVGGASGSLGTEQLAWLDRTLAEHRDDYVLVLSHHPSSSLENLVPDPRRPDEDRHGLDALLRVLHRNPQVVAWVNGHAHHNKITAHPDPDGRAGFWEINTASHIDAPQQSRVIELAVNGDGTLSLFTTLVDALAPVRTRYDDHTPAGLASLYRELAFNDQPRYDRAGEPGDGNTELLLADPFR